MLTDFVKKLKFLLTKRDKQFLLGLLIFSLVISLIETIGISAIMPFISVATDFSLIHTNSYYQSTYTLLGYSRESDFVIGFGILLILFYIFRSGVNLVYFHLLARFSQGRYHLLAYRLFENYMGMPYHVFTQKNSSTLTKSIINEASNLTQVINAMLFMMSEMFVVILIYGMLLYVNWKITLLLTVILVVNALFLTLTISKRIKRSGEARAEIQKVFYEIINKTFGNFKLIKLQTNDQETLKAFSVASSGFAQANIRSQTLQHFPRLFLEAIGFGLITFVITFLVWKYQNNIQNLFALISMFVLALYRLMPSVNRIMSSYNQIMFNHKAMEIIHNDLMYEQEMLGNKTIAFNDEIRLEKISFEYEKERPIFEELSLTIRKGEKVAFIGQSGSGKSTLVDLVIGLYRPRNGSVAVDGVVLDDTTIKSWRKKVGYIPQSVYLFDGTVGENIAFDRDYDEAKIDDCLKKAKIYDFLKGKAGQNTMVGEGGILLSGGQKQRIAIARALYSDPEVLVLDEATSALDQETEAAIMEEIYELSEGKTLIIIAHRLSTIAGCNAVYSLEAGKIRTVEP